MPRALAYFAEWFDRRFRRRSSCGLGLAAGADPFPGEDVSFSGEEVDSRSVPGSRVCGGAAGGPDDGVIVTFGIPFDGSGVIDRLTAAGTAAGSNVGLFKLSWLMSLKSDGVKTPLMPSGVFGDLTTSSLSFSAAPPLRGLNAL